MSTVSVAAKRRLGSKEDLVERILRDGDLLFRGTQRKEIAGVRKGVSWTPSLGAALIWASRPPDTFSVDPKRRKATFLPTSTIHVGESRAKRSLELAADNHVHFSEILTALEYREPNGLTRSDAHRILQYMHNRLLGHAKGGEFEYKVYDWDDEEFDEADLPLSLTDPETAISWFKDSWNDTLNDASRLVADTFIYADAPATQKAAVRLGYELMFYRDLFQGALYTSEYLLGVKAEDLKGVEMEYDLSWERVPVHDTMRPLHADAVRIVGELPVETVMERIGTDFLVE